MRLAHTSRKPSASRLIEKSFGAPIGGINSVDAGSSMPITDCVYLYNMIAAELGLRSRLGSKEWVTGLDGPVRSGIPFNGSTVTANKLFQTTFSGIWDCTNSTMAPVQVVTFGIQSGNAGRGVSCVFPTPAGHFLFYCDEENGLYLYKQQTSTWIKIVAGVTQPWAPSTFYQVGNQVVNAGNTYTCTTEGTSATGAGPTTTGAGIGDGSVFWTGTPGVTANAIGPSLGDQQAGLTLDPAALVFPVVWMSRLWLVEKATARAWYLGINAIQGTATSFPFGSRMRAGGALAGLWTWAYDAGGGMNTKLVGISDAGDVVIYEGTDPASPSTFQLVGTWSLGNVVSGRRIATDYGGDILVMSTQGLIPLSALVVGQPVVAGSRSVYSTQKIGPLFSLLANTYGAVQGWSICIHPAENALLITIPMIADYPGTQLLMSFTNKSWSQYRDLPMTCAVPWQGTLYFGTADGRVMKNEGYVDEVKLADPNAYTPVLWSLLTSFQNLDTLKRKQIQFLRPEILSDTPNALVQATAKYDFDSSEPLPPSGTLSQGSSTWDSATWDSGIWGGGYTPTTPMQGGFGMGTNVAVAVQGRAISRTILTGIGVAYSERGIL
jgi:hypothetical protein